MMNRLRTALVSVIAVAVAMMVLGSNARAGSVSTASPQNYLSFLQGLTETHNGISLMQRYSSLDRTMNILKHIPLPGPRLVRQIATLYNQELMVFSNIQKNINALLATQAALQVQYQALQSQKEALLAAGRVNRARQVAMQQGQVYNVVHSVQSLIVAERGVATPTR